MADLLESSGEKPHAAGENFRPLPDIVSLAAFSRSAEQLGWEQLALEEVAEQLDAWTNAVAASRRTEAPPLLSASCLLRAASAWAQQEQQTAAPRLWLAGSRALGAGAALAHKQHGAVSMQTALHLGFLCGQVLLHPRRLRSADSKDRTAAALVAAAVRCMAAVCKLAGSCSSGWEARDAVSVHSALAQVRQRLAVLLLGQRFIEIMFKLNMHRTRWVHVGHRCWCRSRGCIPCMLSRFHRMCCRNTSWQVCLGEAAGRVTAAGWLECARLACKEISMSASPLCVHSLCFHPPRRHAGGAAAGWR